VPSALRIVVFALLVTGRTFAEKDYRQESCKTPETAQTCVHVHGRLTAGNGTPSTRLWRIGTHHVYGIYSNQYGFTHDSQTLDNEAPELHFNLPKDTPNVGGWTISGDFEVCALETAVEGHMQAACIVSATHIVAPQQ
jgi:hypothetical protein